MPQWQPSRHAHIALAFCRCGKPLQTRRSARKRLAHRSPGLRNEDRAAQTRMLWSMDPSGGLVAGFVGALLAGQT